MRGLARTWLRRRPRTPAGLRLALAVLCAGLGLASVAGGAQSSAPAAAGGSPPTKQPLPPAAGELQAPTPSSPALLAEGRTLYREGCSTCHGMNLEGRRGYAPALRGVGAGPPDFYLSTGRMPLENPHLQPERTKPRYPPAEIAALVAYVASFGGPPAPDAQPSKGDLALGLHDFTLDCAGCHQIVARGGLTIGAVVPDLQDATPRQIAEAVRMGPYLMPHFDSRQLDQHELDSVARYVLWTRHPDDRGGWGIYNLGPIPEGIVAWFMLLAALVLFARLIGERIEPGRQA